MEDNEKLDPQLVGKVMSKMYDTEDRPIIDSYKYSDLVGKVLEFQFCEHKRYLNDFNNIFE